MTTHTSTNKRYSIALALLGALLISSNLHAASNGMAINDDGIELSYDPNPTELIYLGAGNYHFDLLTSNETHPRNVLFTLEAEPHDWRITWQERKLMIAPTVQALVVDYQDTLFIAPAAGLLMRKQFAPLWNDQNSMIEANLNLAPGFLTLGRGGTVWGSQISITQPVVPELSAKIGLRFIKAKREGVNMGKLEQGLYIGVKHNF